jgi:hypothetical protein
VDGLENYFELVREKLKTSPEVESFTEGCFVKQQPHELILKTYLDLLGFFVMD